MQLTNEMEEIVARFVPATPGSRLTATVGSVSGQHARDGSTGIVGVGAGANNKGKDIATTMGEIQVVDDLVFGEAAKWEVLCSALVVVERAKRRQTRISGVVAGKRAALGR